MYHHYPNSGNRDGSFSVEDVRHGLIALHTDYTCPFCGKHQSVAQLGGYGGHCIQCGESSNPHTSRLSSHVQ